VCDSVESTVLVAEGRTLLLGVLEPNTEPAITTVTFTQLVAAKNFPTKMIDEHRRIVCNRTLHR
jgi:hypothetical protein